MATTGKSINFESEGRAVQVDLLYTVAAKRIVYVDGWLGLTVEAGDSGDSIALVTDDREYQFYVPDGLSVSMGDTVYVRINDLTGHVPDDTAYNTDGDNANDVALFKATSDKVTSGGTGNHYCTGISRLHKQ